MVQGLIEKGYAYQIDGDVHLPWTPTRNTANFPPVRWMRC